MNTPIIDFVEHYKELNMTRVHMPGHKGIPFIGCEPFDITEIKGADALYEADGIIAESERNATLLFGSGRTIYSTEGSSQCIRAMLYLAMTDKTSDKRPVIVATRNVHKSFVQAVALLDLDVEWLYPEDNMHSICSCNIKAETLDRKLKGMKQKPIAVYVTSPDYLGGQLDIQSLADVCHKNNTILAVDNAHGAYLKFLESGRHPLDLGADICCDSAHKTLPALTGAAYLHIHKNAPRSFGKNAKTAMALFGSTSPSYLTLMSLDFCNRYLSENYINQLKDTIVKVEHVRGELQKLNWLVEETDPLKLTVRVPNAVTGIGVASVLCEHGVECEYADLEYVVCMFTPENKQEDFQRVVEAFGENQYQYNKQDTLQTVVCETVTTIREAVFAKHGAIPVEQSIGRICGTPTVSCPPAIPIVVSGERISKEAVDMFQVYGIEIVDVVEE